MPDTRMTQLGSAPDARGGERPHELVYVAEGALSTLTRQERRRRERRAPLREIVIQLACFAFLVTETVAIGWGLAARKGLDVLPLVLIGAGAVWFALWWDTMRPGRRRAQ